MHRNHAAGMANSVDREASSTQALEVWPFNYPKISKKDKIAISYECRNGVFGSQG